MVCTTITATGWPSGISRQRVCWPRRIGHWTRSSWHGWRRISAATQHAGSTSPTVSAQHSPTNSVVGPRQARSSTKPHWQWRWQSTSCRNRNASNGRDNSSASIESNGGALTTGIHGTRFLLPALADTGSLSTAYELLMRTNYPSWQHSIAHGATTVWERWDAYVDSSGFQTPAMNSMNHPALGSVAEWLHAYVAGLRPGSRTVQIRPYPGGGLTNASTATQLSGQRCAVEWDVRMDHLELRCTIPSGVAWRHSCAHRRTRDLGGQRRAAGRASCRLGQV